MIAKVIRGWRPAGLIAYLMGPGLHEEHCKPRVVAVYDGVPGYHQPSTTGSGEFDFDLRSLIESMQELPRGLGLRLNNPPPTPDGLPGAEEWSEWLRTAGKRKPPWLAPDWVKHYRCDKDTGAIVLKPGYVWHCPVRLHPDDPVLKDEQWEPIAQQIMEATGIHQAGCRWIAVRHADDHIHLMATLVTEVDGRLKRFQPRNDWIRLRTACQTIERELGLVPTPDIDRTAGKTPTRAEHGKAIRTGQPEPARVKLRRLVSQAAAAASGPEEFFALLAELPVHHRLSHGADGSARGCAFAIFTDRTRGGEVVWFGGGKLAADLAWPRLLRRWSTVPAVGSIERNMEGRPTPAGRRVVLDEGTVLAHAAATQVRARHEDPDGVAHAAGEMLAALALIREAYTPGPLTAASELFDRAARSPLRVLPEPLGPLARDLRYAARRLAMLGASPSRGSTKVAFAALVLALVSLITEICAWQLERGRIHQAAAAERAAGALLADCSCPG